MDLIFNIEQVVDISGDAVKEEVYM